MSVSSASPSDLRRVSLVWVGCLLIALAGLAWQPAGPADWRAEAAMLADTATPTVVPGAGAIAGHVWQDLNGDGLQSPGDPPLAGVALTLYESATGQALFSTTTGSDGSYRFATLSPGYYRLTATAPAGYRLTTPAYFDVFVSVGAVLMLDFGAHFVPTNTPTNTPVPQLDTVNAPFAICGGVISADTRQSVNRVRQYGCRPAWDESGPELVYRLEFGRSQMLTAVLLAASADLDLFLVRSSEGDSCVAAGDTYLTHQVEPGVYFLVVDGYQGASGPFTLRLECPLGIQATATPTRTPSPTFTRGPTFTPTPTSQPRRSYLPLIVRGYPSAPPQTATLFFQQGREGYGGAADTTLNAWEPEASFGGADLLRLRYDRSPDDVSAMAPVLRFDLALLPSEANVVTASLQLYLVEKSNQNDLRGQVHGLLRSWDEATATWQQASAGAVWTKPGAHGAGTDHMTWAADIQLIGDVNRWYTFDVTDLAQLWVKDPARNHGLVVLAKAGTGQARVDADFASREYGDPALRPQLIVAYWVPAARTAKRTVAS